MMHYDVKYNVSRFLQGACTKEKCLLSHKLDPEKMPACKFFLEGLCTKDNCPYLHVKVTFLTDLFSLRRQYKRTAVLKTYPVIEGPTIYVLLLR